MGKLRYFPFGEQFDLRMGTAAFKQEDKLVETDLHYLKEISIKRALLETDHRYYYRSAGDTMLAQWDVVDLILTDLCRFQPEDFQLEKQGNEWHWNNRITGEELFFRWGKDGSLPYEPLDWVGRQVQEDLVILGNDDSAALVAGQLCFANGYSLDDKYGQPFLTIHSPAPGMIGPMMQAAQKLMERILVGRSVWRASWNFKISNAMDLSSRHTENYNRELATIAPGLTTGNIGPKVFIRIERQTLTRLPLSNCILFGIHVHQNTVEDEAGDPQRARQMLNVLKTTPREMLDYKAITPFETALLGYLEQRQMQSDIS